MVRIDLSRPPNARERTALGKRRTRVERAQKSRTVAMGNLGKLALERELAMVRIRGGFIRLAVPLVGDTSDRSAPPHEHRPPATRLMSPNGIGLRLMLVALFEAQSRTPPGARADGTPIPLRAAHSGAIGWTTVTATSAQASGTGRHRMGVIDKQVRQLQTTLGKLEKEALIEPVDSAKQGSGRYEGFYAMSEDVLFGHPGDVYRVPDGEESYFEVPVALFTSGWIHVLEDSELALLLITMRMRHIHGDEPQKLAAGTRLLHYGLSRDAFEAHIMLSRLGLLEVTEDAGRSMDGKVHDYTNQRAQPHELLFLPAGLEHDAGAAVTAEIDYQFSR